jgi:hypothetical protein
VIENLSYEGSEPLAQLSDLSCASIAAANFTRSLIVTSLSKARRVGSRHPEMCHPCSRSGVTHVRSGVTYVPGLVSPMFPVWRHPCSRSVPLNSLDEFFASPSSNALFPPKSCGARAHELPAALRVNAFDSKRLGALDRAVRCDVSASNSWV